MRDRDRVLEAARPGGGAVGPVGSAAAGVVPRLVEVAAPRPLGGVHRQPLLVPAVGVEAGVEAGAAVGGGQDLGEVVGFDLEAVVVDRAVRRRLEHRVGAEDARVERAREGPGPPLVGGVAHPRLAEVVGHRVELAPAHHDPGPVGELDRDRRLVGRVAEDVLAGGVHVDLNADPGTLDGAPGGPGLAGLVGHPLIGVVEHLVGPAGWRVRFRCANGKHGEQEGDGGGDEDQVTHELRASGEIVAPILNVSFAPWRSWSLTAPGSCWFAEDFENEATARHCEPCGAGRSNPPGDVRFLSAGASATGPSDPWRKPRAKEPRGGLLRPLQGLAMTVCGMRASLPSERPRQGP